MRRSKDKPSDARLAVAFQAVEVRGEQGAVKLVINVLAHTENPTDLSDWLASGWQPNLHRARELADREMQDVERRVNAMRMHQDLDGVRDEMKRIPGILHHLSENIERGFRQETRRTRHAENRREEHRPVHKAIEDTLAAQPEGFFYDEKTSTIVVCGPQGRAHVYNEDGKHVTSFALRPDSIDFRLRTKRWRLMPAGEAEEFKHKVEKLIPEKGGKV